MPNFPQIDKDNPYLMVRWDNCVIDAKDFDLSIKRPTQSTVGRIFWGRDGDQSMFCFVLIGNKTLSVWH